MSEVTNVTIVGQLFLGYDHTHKDTCNHVKIILDSFEARYSINNEKKVRTMSRKDTDVLFQEIAKTVQSMISKHKGQRN